jgi:hypothetical protein
MSTSTQMQLVVRIVPPPYNLLNFMNVKLYVPPVKISHKKQWHKKIESKDLYALNNIWFPIGHIFLSQKSFKDSNIL